MCRVKAESKNEKKRTRDGVEERFVTKGEKMYKHTNPTGLTRGWAAQ